VVRRRRAAALELLEGEGRVDLLVTDI